MSEALDKLESLRDANKKPTPEDVERYNQLERDIKQRERYADFLEHPITKEIVERIIGWIKSENDLLISGKGGEKNALHRDDLLNLLAIFSPSKSKTEHLVKDIPQQIKDFEVYYHGFPGT